MPFIIKILVPLLTLVSSFISAQSPIALDWVQHFGTNQSDKGHALALDQNFIYSLGSFSGTLNNLASNGQEDILLCKHSKQGNLIWMRNWGSNGSDQANCIRVQHQKIIIAGYFKDTVSNYTDSLISQGEEDIFISNYSTNGQLNWAKSFGGSRDEAVNDLVLDAAGNIYICGYFEDSLRLGADLLIANNLRSIFIAKLDSQANPIWAKQASGPHYDEGMGIALDVHNNVYLTGHYRDALFFSNDTLMGSSSSNEMLLISYDNSGNRRWVKSLGGNYSDIGYRLCFDKEGNFYHTGWFNQELFIDNDTLYADHPEGAEIVIGKYDTLGNRLWIKAVGGQHEEYTYALAVDNSNNLIFAGTFDSSFHVGGRDTLYPRHSTAPTDIFVASISSEGEWLWGQPIGGHKSDYCYGIAVDDTESLYLIGHFQDSSYFEPDSLIAMGATDIFLAKYQIDSNSIISNTPSFSPFGKLEFFPNPCVDHLKVRISHNQVGQLQLNIFDLLGRPISRKIISYTNNNSSQTVELSTQDLAPGYYLLDVQLLQFSKQYIFHKL